MNPIEFARNLFLLRREHGMTIEELGLALEVSPEIICEWECAKTSPTLEQMNRLAKVYGIPLAQVIRSPKSGDEPPASIPTPEGLEGSGFSSESAPEAEPESSEEPSTEPPADPDPKKKKGALWEILVILLLLLIIGAALVFLIRPEYFPFRELFGARAILRPFGF